MSKQSKEQASVPPTKYNRDPKFFFAKSDTPRRFFDLAPSAIIAIGAIGAVAGIAATALFVSWWIPKILPGMLAETPRGTVLPSVRPTQRTVADDVLPATFTISVPATDAIAGCVAQAKGNAGDQSQSGGSTACPLSKQQFLTHAVLIRRDGALLAPATAFVQEAGKDHAIKTKKFDTLLAWDQNGRPYPVVVQSVRAPFVYLSVSGVHDVAPVIPRVGLLVGGESLTVLERAAFAASAPSGFNQSFLQGIIFTGRDTNVTDKFGDVAGASVRAFPFVSATGWNTGSLLVDSDARFVGFVVQGTQIVWSPSWAQIWQTILANVTASGALIPVSK